MPPPRARSALRRAAVLDHFPAGLPKASMRDFTDPASLCEVKQMTFDFGIRHLAAFTAALAGGQRGGGGALMRHVCCWPIIIMLLGELKGNTWRWRVHRKAEKRAARGEK